MVPPNDDDRGKELVLPPGTHAMLLDTTKGLVRVYVGPAVVNQTNSERPVRFDTTLKPPRFVDCDLRLALAQNIIAPEGYYVVLMNPTKTGVHPSEGKNDTPDFAIGEKINIPGPCNFALFPGQQVELRRGHHLASNEYLLVKIYNEEKARANWSKAVIRETQQTGIEQLRAQIEDPKTLDDERTKLREQLARLIDATATSMTKVPDDLAVGKQYNVLGTQVSFYIPPTGVSVVPEEGTQPPVFVRAAETLEQLEYSVLVDEDGNKMYPKGPAVVFPRPTQHFVEQVAGDGTVTRKYRAIEMNALQGIQLKFIADVELTFADDSKHSYKAGQEVFITGKEMPIYFPEEGHQLVTYDAKTMHYAVAIPEGEARYLMDRHTSAIQTIRGPVMLLPNPVDKIIIRRALSDRESLDWFPGPDGTGSTDSLAYNQWLRNEAGREPTTRQGVVSEGRIENAARGGRGGDFGTELAQSYTAAGSMSAIAASSFGMDRVAPRIKKGLVGGGVDKSRQGHTQDAVVGDVAERRSTYNEPRTITFANKYKGVPTIKVQPGFAISVVQVDGTRDVIVGPATVLLDYGQTLDVLALSTGKPKTTDRLFRTAYLKVQNNVVSDMLTVETADHVKVGLKLAYNIDFGIAKKDEWFTVENYVKYVTDHVRSVLKGKVRKITVDDFYASSTDIIRSSILGDAPTAGERRPGMSFDNGAHISDVEVLDAAIGDAGIAKLLSDTQHEVIQKTIQLAQAARNLHVTQETERLNRESALATHDTALHKARLAMEVIESNRRIEAAKEAAEAAAFDPRRAVCRLQQELLDIAANATRARLVLDHDEETRYSEEEQRLRILAVQADADSFAKRLTGISPALIEVMTTASRNDVLAKVAEMAAPRMLLGATSLTDFLRQTFAGFPTIEAAITSMGQQQRTIEQQPTPPARK
jgi:major vault protein